MATRKEEDVFMFDNDLKELSFYCGNDNCYEATFVRRNGMKASFMLSKEKTLEYMKTFYPQVDVESIKDNKAIIVDYFHKFAMEWYKQQRGK